MTASLILAEWLKDNLPDSAGINDDQYDRVITRIRNEETSNNKQIAILQTPVGTHATTMGGGYAYETEVIDLVSRDVDYEGADEIASAMNEFLSTNPTIPGIHSVRAMGPPHLRSRDEKERVLFSQRWELWRLPE